MPSESRLASGPLARETRLAPLPRQPPNKLPTNRTSHHVKSRDLPVIPLSAEPVRAGVDPGAKAVTLDIEPIGPADGPKIGLVTLGCDKNTVDSEHMMAALVGHGARVSGEVHDADVVIVNTCGFIEAAKEQSVETILEACELKAEGDVQAVVAVGCMVQRYKDELWTSFWA